MNGKSKTLPMLNHHMVKMGGVKLHEFLTLAID
jgi:hypothetical protein